MKILENGEKVKIVDTKEDLDLVCEMMGEDKLFKVSY